MSLRKDSKGEFQFKMHLFSICIFILSAVYSYDRHMKRKKVIVCTKQMKITPLKGGVMKKFSLVVICLAVLGLLASATFIQAAEKSKVNVTGKWSMVVETSQGSGTPTFTLKQDGNKLTGTYSGFFGEAPVTGTVKGNDVEIKYTMRGSLTIYKGKVDGNKIVGTVDIGGGQATGTFDGMKE
jgi:hypothetical protein